MKKLLALVVVLVIAWAPMSFAACAICDSTTSDSWGKATGAKVVRGIANTGLGWSELIRQPVIAENKFQGVGNGVVEAFRRTGVGVLQLLTFPFPNVHTPELTPSCPLEY